MGKIFLLTFLFIGQADISGLIQSGVPPALPGRQSNFENSGSILPLLLSCCRSPFLSELRAVAVAVAFAFHRLRSGPFEGPATVKPPALPEDTYSPFALHMSVSMGRPYEWDGLTNETILSSGNPHALRWGCGSASSADHGTTLSISSRKSVAELVQRLPNGFSIFA
jgi:hypothetical protein